MVIQNIIGGEFVGSYRDLHSNPIPMTPELAAVYEWMLLANAKHRQLNAAKFSDRLRNEKLFNLEQSSHNHG